MSRMNGKKTTQQHNRCFDERRGQRKGLYITKPTLLYHTSGHYTSTVWKYLEGTKKLRPARAASLNSSLPFCSLHIARMRVLHTRCSRFIDGLRGRLCVLPVLSGMYFFRFSLFSFINSLVVFMYFCFSRSRFIFLSSRRGTGLATAYITILGTERER